MIIKSRRIVRTWYLFLCLGSWATAIIVLLSIGLNLPDPAGWFAYPAAAGIVVWLIYSSIGWLTARMFIDRRGFHSRWWPERLDIAKDEIATVVSELYYDGRLSLALFSTSTTYPKLYYLVVVLTTEERICVMASFAPRRISLKQRDQILAWLEEPR